MRGKAFVSRAVAARFISAIAFICGVRILFTIGLPDATDIARVAITMKCEHRVLFGSGHARSRAVLHSAQQCLSNMHITVCVERLAGHGYTELVTEWLRRMFLTVFSQMISEQSLLRV